MWLSVAIVSVAVFIARLWHEIYIASDEEQNEWRDNR